MPSRKKPSLHSLITRQATDEEADALLKAFYEADPLVMAILGQSLVEYELDLLIRRKFPMFNDDTWATLTAENGPFCTFNAKILMGRALRLYDDTLRDHLKLIKGVRNAFAHSKALLTFDNPVILDALRTAKIPPRKGHLYKVIISVRDPATPAQAAFKMLTEAVCIEIIRKHSRSITASMRNYRRTRAKLVTQEITSLASSQALAALWSPTSHTDGPTRLGVLQSPSQDDPKKDGP